MISPKDIIEYLFGVKISRKADWIINSLILAFIISMAFIIMKSKHSG